MDEPCFLKCECSSFRCFFFRQLAEGHNKYIHEGPVMTSLPTVPFTPQIMCLFIFLITLLNVVCLQTDKCVIREFVVWTLDSGFTCQKMHSNVFSLKNKVRMIDYICIFVKTKIA